MFKYHRRFCIISNDGYNWNISRLCSCSEELRLKYDI